MYLYHGTLHFNALHSISMPRVVRVERRDGSVDRNVGEVLGAVNTYGVGTVRIHGLQLQSRRITDE